MPEPIVLQQSHIFSTFDKDRKNKPTKDPDTNCRGGLALISASLGEDAPLYSRTYVSIIPRLGTALGGTPAPLKAEGHPLTDAA